jgi:hypothetical protein
MTYSLLIKHTRPSVDVAYYTDISESWIKFRAEKYINSGRMVIEFIPVSDLVQIRKSTYPSIWDFREYIHDYKTFGSGAAYMQMRDYCSKNGIVITMESEFTDRDILYKDEQKPCTGCIDVAACVKRISGRCLSPSN